LPGAAAGAAACCALNLCQAGQSPAEGGSGPLRWAAQSVLACHPSVYSSCFLGLK